jgi:heat shock protein HtpX
LNPLQWHRHTWQNRLQTALTLAFMLGFLALLGLIIWGNEGLLQLLLIGLILALINPVASPRLVLRLYGAQPLHEYQVPLLFDALAKLAQRAELPALPALYYVPSRMVNAFTVGSRRAPAIAVSDGMLRTLNLREMVAVLAHEVSHIRNNDIRVMALADMISRMTSLLSLFGQLLLLVNLPLLIWAEQQINWLAIALLVFAPHLALIAQLGLSRTREFNADLNAAWLTGDPQGMAQALVKIEQLHQSLFESLMLPGWKVPEPSWLRTHPRTEERVQRLAQLVPAKRAASLTQLNGQVFDDVERQGIRRRPRYHISGLWY